ncbi:MAG: hypothetical protein ACTHNP_10940 [Solirubrobacterales bacterium]
MKHLKTLGLALVAAAALTAIAGAGTASATVLCKNNLNTETCSEKYPVGTVGVASLTGTGVMETLAGTVINTCTSSTAKETLQNEGSATTTVAGKVAAAALSWSGCTSPVNVLAGGEAELHWISGTDNGTITAKGFEVTTTLSGVSCTYGLGSTMKDWGVVVGGAPGSLEVNSVVKKVAGSFACPAEARLTGKYVNTEPKAAYVAAG